jgi:hypothetical protein
MQRSIKFLGGALGARGDLSLKLHRGGPGLLWRLKNFPHWWRGFWRKEIARIVGISAMVGEVAIKVTHADGSVTDYGTVSFRLVTTAYVTAMATYQFDGSGTAPTVYDYHDVGTGTTAESAGDTALVTPYGGSRATGTPTNPGAGQYRTAGTLSFTTGQAITEHGVFSASSSGTLMDRSVFSAINVVNGDSLTATYTITYSSGG